MKSQRWTKDLIKSSRSNLDARINQVLMYSESQLRAEMKTKLGFTPDTSVSLEALRRWLIGVAIEFYFPDSPPTPAPPQGNSIINYMNDRFNSNETPEINQ